jgi:hypothetical protein
MSSSESYPQWGAFGATEAPAAPASKASEGEGAAADLVIDLKMRIGLIEIETAPTDSLAQIETAMQKAHDLNASPPSPLHNTTVRRSNASALDVIIDRALREVGADARLGVVYAELVRQASTSDRPKPFTGPASVSGIPYLHNNGRESHFTSRALMGRLKTLRKARP